MVIWLDPQSDIIDFIRDVIDFFCNIQNIFDT